MSTGSEYLETAIAAARRSGAIMLNYFDRVHDARQKNENARDLVTEVDLLSERSIRETIGEKYPAHGFIGEELDGAAQRCEHTWYIDPLDGTVNYSQGLTLCAVSLALARGEELLAGVIYNPFSEELFYAIRAGGAFLNGRRLRVSAKADLRECLFVAAFSSARGEAKRGEYELFGAANDCSRGALRIGSAALALAWLAAGRIDGMWAIDLLPWDLAAGRLLVSEAGGRVSDRDGKPYGFGGRHCIGTNGANSENVIALVRRHV